MRPLAPLTCSLALLLALGACAPPGDGRPPVPEDPGAPVAAPPGAPADTVFLIEGEPITASEIDAQVETYRLVEPAKSLHALRRFVLTNQVLQRHMTRLLAPEEHAAARFRIEQARAHLAQGGEPNEAIQVQRLHDTWASELGLDRWGTARNLAPGEWSEVLEGPGYVTFVRLLGAPPAEDWVGNTEATIEHVTEYYIEPEFIKDMVEGAYGQITLQVVDPEWRRYLPTFYLHQKPPTE